VDFIVGFGMRGNSPASERRSEELSMRVPARILANDFVATARLIGASLK
jgi:hypothetical protein